jgi:5-methylcytosine-specific restriction endonuclease McrA
MPWKMRTHKPKGLPLPSKPRLAPNRRGYGPNWQKLRLLKLRTDPLCEVCGKLATQVHHRDGNVYNLADENLASLCASCHARISAKEHGFGGPGGGMNSR